MTILLNYVKMFFNNKKYRRKHIFYYEKECENMSFKFYVIFIFLMKLYIDVWHDTFWLYPVVCMSLQFNIYDSVMYVIVMIVRLRTVWQPLLYTFNEYRRYSNVGVNYLTETLCSAVKLILSTLGMDKLTTIW